MPAPYFLCTAVSSTPTTNMSSGDESPIDTSLFQEPEGYYEPDKPHTHVEHTLRTGEVLKLRLVGHNPLWVKAATLPSSSPASLNVTRDTCYGMPDGWSLGTSRGTRLV